MRNRQCHNERERKREREIVFLLLLLFKKKTEFVVQYVLDALSWLLVASHHHLRVKRLETKKKLETHTKKSLRHRMQASERRHGIMENTVSHEEYDSYYLRGMGKTIKRR